MSPALGTVSAGDYIVVKLVTNSTAPCVPEEFSRTQSPITEHAPNSVTHERNKDKKLMTQKILEHTNKIIHLLTGEVPIKCDDVAVFFSVEEWEYIERHKDLYKNIMENHQTLGSLEKCRGGPTARMEKPFPLWENHHLTSNTSKGQKRGQEEHEQGDGSMSRKSHAGCHSPVKIMTKKSSLCEEENLIDSHISTLKEDTGTDCVSSLKCGKGNINAHPMPNNLSVKQYKCSECGVNFNNESSYITHQRTHTTARLYNCSGCKKCFTINSNLVNHQTIHKKECLFVCCECGKQFCSKSSFVKHQRIHIRKKIFPCSECGKFFSTKSHLVEHKKIHSGVKPFACSQCGKCFLRKSALLSHQIIHTVNNIFVCLKCGKRYTRKLHLVKHQRSHTENYTL
ncbi:oocyte zinc finger protein XlCOF7.1-like isoform X2 [Ascaphus truei]|uniref:oocyte zinc finger protein XlCOF7.1-like isoform X2 n=1 Tax=Ascaphus truei TaxID=8439 RepID=UPI003F5AAA91